MSTPSLVCLLLFLSLTAANGQATEPPTPIRVINSFETAADLAAIQTWDSTAEASALGVTDGRQAALLRFQAKDYPGFWTGPTAGSFWDLGDRGLAFDLTNPGPDKVKFTVNVEYLGDNGPADKRALEVWAEIGPSRTERFMIRMKPERRSYGLLSLPPVSGIKTLDATTWAKGFQPRQVCGFKLWLPWPGREVALIIDGLRVLPEASRVRFIDPFGQFSRADWPGKLKNEEEFSARRAADEADLKAIPALPGRDQYGGLAGGPQLPATGFFRAEKYNGKWWLVTPDGHLFFSVGLDCMGPGAGTPITGRESMFNWLPAADDPLAQHYGGGGDSRSFDFYGANLQRKYGFDYKKRWEATALTRLPSWGFNTIGAWSGELFWPESGWLFKNTLVPYVCIIHPSGDYAGVCAEPNKSDSLLPDPFDVRYASAVAKSLGRPAAKAQKDPWCLGYFVDNELSWGKDYGIAQGTLLLDAAASPAKQALVGQLRDKYRDISALNAAWRTGFKSWQELSAPVPAPDKLDPAANPDLSAFCRRYSEQYFRTVRDQLKKADPDHLYLGCRFSSSPFDTVAAAGQYCDVVSFNRYQNTPDISVKAVPAGFNAPCLIGEFHFGADDRGMFYPSGYAQADNQADRAAKFQAFVRAALSDPLLVGCHWFQWVDQPLTGRGDGENYNTGFVSVTDTPYPELVQAARTVLGQMYQYRLSAPAAAVR